MDYKKSAVFILELIGIPFLILAGLSLSFAYKASNKNFAISFFSIVDTSLWEQLKISFFPIIFYALIEKVFSKTNLNNFFTAKAAAFICMSTFLSFSYLLLDFKATNCKLSNTITILLIGYSLSQALSCIIINLIKNYPYINLIAFILLIIISILFFSFTVNPPNNWLFEASRPFITFI